MRTPGLGNQYACVIENNVYGRNSHVSLKDPLFSPQYILLLESGLLSNGHIFQELPTFLCLLFYAETGRQWLISSGDIGSIFIPSEAFKVYPWWSSHSLMPRWSNGGCQARKENSGTERFTNLPKAMQCVWNRMNMRDSTISWATDIGEKSFMAKWVMLICLSLDERFEIILHWKIYSEKLSCKTVLARV